nr:MAG TPA: hypothetical protein [Caudoviricetes sp.]DAY96773.1 MAG TPA: hypothetical protein [Caudoviricetes sp.]
MCNVGSELLKIRLGSRCVAIIDGRKRSFSKVFYRFNRLFFIHGSLLLS